MEIVVFLGIGCVLYTAAEIFRLSRLAQPIAAEDVVFGAVDIETGNPVSVTVDRRVRNDPDLAFGRRRSDC